MTDVTRKNISLRYPSIYRAAAAGLSRPILSRVHFGNQIAIAANGFLAVVCAVTNSHGPIALGKDAMNWLCGRSGEVSMWVEKVNGKYTVDRREYGSAAKNRTILGEDYDEKLGVDVAENIINPLLDQADLDHAICVKPAYLKQIIDTFGKTDGVYLIPTIPPKIKPKEDETETEKTKRENRNKEQQRAAPIVVIPMDSDAAIAGILMPMHISYGKTKDPITTVRKNIPGLRTGDAKKIAKKLLDIDGKAE